jgi:UDP-N-acetylglucosamine--N-acetylmuramyl-(pentapeptide) pyrophosphoryl-undecaprenol N-acetylglucosamine transferase
VALAVGVTAGHFYPALAVAEAYLRRASDTEVVFFGPRGFGAELAARHHCRYYRITGAQLARTGAGGRLIGTARTLAGIVQARRQLHTLKARLVIGFGGYSSGAILLAARTLRLTTAVHEANVRPGLANRWIARVVDRVYVNHAEAAQFLAAQSLGVTGWPVRSQVCALAEWPRQSWRGSRPARILVCAASRGGSFFAREVPALLERLASMEIPLEVHHQSGDVEPLPIELAYTRAGIVARVSPFIDDMATAYRWADLAIVRAGAGTIAELALAGLPALLVPLANAADDHQTVNARAFVASGAAAWAHQRDWDARAVAAQLAHLLSDSESFAAMSSAARRLAAPGAADALVDDCEALMRGRW